MVCDVVWLRVVHFVLVCRVCDVPVHVMSHVRVVADTPLTHRHLGLRRVRRGGLLWMSDMPTQHLQQWNVPELLTMSCGEDIRERRVVLLDICVWLSGVLLERSLRSLQPAEPVLRDGSVLLHMRDLRRGHE